ncbi:MAG: phage portal protein [Muribaculaceae bacterium]|nr:phage portal protein [Muribaculaceae bacterium]
MSEQSNIVRPVHASVILGGTGFYNPYMPVRKADTDTQLTKDETNTGAEWIEPPIDRAGLKNLVDTSTILPQCIKSYASNIAGYGIGVRYINDKNEPNPEAEEELARMEHIIERLSLENDTKIVFENAIEGRETYGAGYLEVIRDGFTGDVMQIDYIEDTDTVYRSVKDATYTQYTTYRRGEAISTRKRFCHYKQEIAGKIVYFKEFGDPRVMNMHTGEYVPSGEPIAPEDQANEILELKIGSSTYGEIRWRGCITGISGASKAELLNYNYFVNGRHTPLMILIKGGMLDEESESKLKHYMSAIKGEAGQHAFIVLCAEPTGNVVAGMDEKQPEIELKDLSPMLQRDALFLEYMEAVRQKVRSSFLLADLYVGYTTDFNRATAQTAKQTTEEQAFKGEREALAWIINNKLLAGYKFKYVEAYFLEPDMTNVEDLFRILTVCNNAGGLTPNKAREIVYEQLGEQAEPYPEEWGEVPLQIGQTQAAKDAMAQGAGGGYLGTPDLEALGLQLSTQIQKADTEGAPEDVVSVMKSVRRLLMEMQDEKAES